jgi:hypothetical protein
LFSERLQPQFTEAVSGVSADPCESVLRGLHWTVTEVFHDLSMVHRLQPEYLTLFENFLLAKP